MPFIHDGPSLQVTLNFEVGGNLAMLEAMGQIAQASVLSTVIINGLAQFLVGGSMQLMWSMINTLQVLYFIPLISVFYPGNVFIMFTFLGIVNMENVLF